GRNVLPVSGALLAALQGGEIQRLARGVRHLQGQGERVPLVRVKRCFGRICDGAGPFGDLAAVGQCPRGGKLFGGLTNGPVRVDRGRDGVQFLRQRDFQAGGGRSAAAVGDAEGEQRVRVCGGRIRRGVHM